MSKKAKEVNSVAGTVVGLTIKLILYGCIIFFLYIGITKGFSFGYNIFNAPAVDAEPGTDKVVVIEEKDSITEVADLLLDMGLIEDKFVFCVQAKFYDYLIHSGTYNLTTSMTSKEILQELNEEPDKDELP